MAKKKGGKSKGYISKGQRPNVSKKNRVKGGVNPVDSKIQSLLKKQQVIEKPQNNKEKELRKRYIKEDEIYIEVARLLNRFGVCGLQKSTAVQAVITEKIEDLNKKWSKILSEYNEAQKKKAVFA